MKLTSGQRLYQAWIDVGKITHSDEFKPVKEEAAARTNGITPKQLREFIRHEGSMYLFENYPYTLKDHRNNLKNGTESPSEYYRHVDATAYFFKEEKRKVTDTELARKKIRSVLHPDKFRSLTEENLGEAFKLFTEYF